MAALKTCHACNGEVEKGDEVIVPRWPGGVFRFHAGNLMCRKAATRRAAHVFPALSGRVGKRVPPYARMGRSDESG